MNRREILKRLLAAGVASVLPGALSPQQSGQEKFLGILDFADEPSYPFATLLGRGLDGRLFTDLATIGPETPITPAEKFYIRSSASPLLPGAASWRLSLGESGPAADLTAADLHARSRPCGLHLMECSGNSRFGHFGLISVAEWDGVPLAELLQPMLAAKVAMRQRVLVSGFDRYPAKSTLSTPGASWIFSVEELADAGAFLATAMNGSRLTRNHGAPVRLVVPGWYGCCCIKWVTRIAFVDDAAPATSQMREFASRTHQEGIPALARDYQPAVIDPAAMPVRVEKWRIGERTSYRVLGIYWGARRPATGLEIQFNPGEPLAAVDTVAPTFDDGWTFWTHTWRPPRPGRYTIRLRVKDRTVRTRRLDSGYYGRTLLVREV